MLYVSKVSKTHVATFSNLDCFLIKQDLDVISQMDNSQQHSKWLYQISPMWVCCLSEGRFVDLYMNSNSSEAGNEYFGFGGQYHACWCTIL